MRRVAGWLLVARPHFGANKQWGFAAMLQSLWPQPTPPCTPPPPADAFGEQLRQAAEAAGNTVLTYSLDSRNADVYAEKVKVGLQRCTWGAPWLLSLAQDRLCMPPPLLGVYLCADMGPAPALPCGHAAPARARALLLCP